MIFKLAVVVVYVLVMLGVGYWCMRRTHTVSDFFLGDRGLGAWLSAFAYGTTYFSAVLFIGYAGKLGWGFGIHGLWIALGNAVVGSFLAWKVLAPRTRAMTGRLNAMTMPDLLSVRFQSPALKLISALIVFVFLVPYSASVYMGLSYLFEKNINIRYEYALAFMALLTGVYIIMGGYFALAITDFIRGALELVLVVLMVTYITSLPQAGGLINATTRLTELRFAPALLANTAIPGWVTLASLVFITSLGPWALPQMVQKFYSIKGLSEIRRAMVISTIFSLIMAFGAYYTGALTHLFYDTLPVQKADELMPVFLTQHTPASVSLLILLLVFSASMSSLSSLVLVSSSAIAMDLYQGMLRPDASRRQVITLMRVLCGVFVACSLLIALRQPTFIVNLMVISWGALAASFLAPYLYGLFWKRTTKAAAIAGMLSGLGISIGLYWLLGEGGIPLAGALAMGVPLVVVPVVSLFTAPVDREIVNKAFGEVVASPEVEARLSEVG